MFFAHCAADKSKLSADIWSFFADPVTNKDINTHQKQSVCINIQTLN